MAGGASNDGLPSPSSTSNNPHDPEPAKMFHFLGLPGELRHIIYQELLLVDRFRLEASESKICVPGPLRLHTAILRVSKEIYEEAVQVIYQENCWIIVNSSIDMSLAICGQLRRPLKPFETIRTSFARDADHTLRFAPALYLIVDTYDRRAPSPITPMHDAIPPRSVQLHEIVLDLASFIRYCRESLIPMRSFNRSIGIHLTEHEVLAKSRAAHQQTVVIKCLKTVRGEGLVPVQTTPTEDPRINYLRESITQPYVTIGDVLEQATKYMMECHMCSRRGEYHVARCLAYEGVHWINTIKCPTGPPGIPSWEERFPETQLIFLQKLRFALAITVAHASHALGDVDITLNVIRHLVAFCPDILYNRESNSEYLAKLTPPQWSAAFYYAGLAFMEKAELNLSAWCLFEALRRAPGDSLVETSIDKLEKRMIHMKYPERVDVEYNFKYILGPFRHGVYVGRGGLTNAQCNAMWCSFVGTEREQDYIKGSLKEPLRPEFGHRRTIEFNV